MSVPDIVFDTDVVIAALRSKRGASSKLLSLVGTWKFEIHDSVPLILSMKMCFNATGRKSVYHKKMFQL